MPAATMSFEPKVGALVNVASRTWPGINKPGGVGKVLGIKIEDDVTLVDVEYVLGGKEKSVEIEFVKEHKFDEENHGRPARSRRSKVTEDELGRKTKKVSSDTKNKMNTVLETLNTNSCDTKATVNKRKMPSTSKGLTSKRSNKSKASGKSQNNSTPISSESENVPMMAANDVKKRVNEKIENQTKNDVENVSPTPGLKSSSLSETTPSRLTGFLKHVYSDMSKKAASFVENVIGKNVSQPSSPESTSSGLEIQADTEREMKFNTTFFDVVRKKMVDCIEINELISEVNALNHDKPFTELEIRTHLQRLDKECKIMVTWDTGTVYMV
mmetsp:Transcript_11440/g.21405  ORF Transcript_11440/g.21405 Transcript_11440/m.21405 type:complete len:327 (-) Transcript_11440:51-1031(-)